MSEERLERMEKKIDTLVLGHAGLAEGQREIRALVEAQGKQLEANTRQLELNTRQLESHGKQLEAHGRQLDAQGKELRRVGVLVEKLQDDVKGIAEGVIGLGERMDREFAEVKARLDDRAVPIEAASRHFASKLADHERRLPKRSRRRKH